MLNVFEPRVRVAMSRLALAMLATFALALVGCEGDTPTGPTDDADNPLIRRVAIDDTLGAIGSLAAAVWNEIAARRVVEAAEDLGCTRLQSFWLVTLPLSRPGVIAGSFLVFIPALGEFVIPSLLGGSDTLMIGKVLYEEFFSNRDWPVAGAVAVVLLLILIIPIVMYQRNEQKMMEADK